MARFFRETRQAVHENRELNEFQTWMKKASARLPLMLKAWKKNYSLSTNAATCFCFRFW